ncbi:hypothetical protein [Nocardia iowensis]|uniref:Uncharacterized protein n=1 Tax=Nocardia iowensis TaxID=204891 RepID=A0ABX8RQH1_NOCIO|nr:hypothetical protein [Nocardia iowensis]QXN91882.1 hypothetical protein KV110_01425 [Nocardia iowensis]
MSPTASKVSLDREIELLRMRTLLFDGGVDELRMRTALHDLQKFDVRFMKATGATQLDNTVFLDIVRVSFHEMTRRGTVQSHRLTRHRSHRHAEDLNESLPVIKWLHRSGSFRTATLRFAHADVERRALGRAGREFEFTEDAVFLDFNVHQASRLACEALASGNAVPPPVAPEGGYPRRADRLLVELLQRQGRAHRAGAASTSGVSRDVFRRALEVMLSAAGTTYHRIRAQLWTASKIVGLTEALGVPQRLLSAEATRAASAIIRVRAERRATHACPGRTVAASPHVSRGPNTAGTPSIPNHLRGLRIQH